MMTSPIAEEARDQGGVLTQEDLGVLLEFAEADETPETIDEIKQTLERLQHQFDEAELQAMLSAPEDASSA